MDRIEPQNNSSVGVVARDRSRLDLADETTLTDEEQDLHEKVRQAAKERTTNSDSTTRDDGNLGAYALACHKNEKVVNLESCPSRFLATSKGDASLAAMGLAAQWDFRRKVLGDDHFFRPLTMTGSQHSALKEIDVQVFRSGFLAILPNDTSGLPVLCYDSCRLERDFSGEEFIKVESSIWRCICYVISVVSENPIAAKEGVTLLMLYHSSYRYVPFEARFQDMVRASLVAYPVASYRIEVVCRPPRRGKTEYQDQIVPTLLSAIRQCHKESQCTLTAFSYTDRLLNALSERGFQQEGLPNSIGGLWNSNRDFVDWRRERNVTEEIREAHATLKDNQVATRVSRVLRQNACQKRKREQDQMYAQRKRERGRQTVLLLQRQVHELRVQQNFLNQEGRRLNHLLVDASRTLQTIQLASSGNFFPRSNTTSTLLPSLSQAFTVPVQIARAQQEPDIQSLLAQRSLAANDSLLPQNFPNLRLNLQMLAEIDAQRRRVTTDHMQFGSRWNGSQQTMHDSQQRIRLPAPVNDVTNALLRNSSRLNANLQLLTQLREQPRLSDLLPAISGRPLHHQLSIPPINTNFLSDVGITRGTLHQNAGWNPREVLQLDRSTTDRELADELRSRLQRGEQAGQGGGPYDEQSPPPT